MSLLFTSIVANFVVWWTLGSYIISNYFTSMILPVMQDNPGVTYSALSVLLIGTTYCTNCFNNKNKFGL